MPAIKAQHILSPVSQDRCAGQLKHKPYFYGLPLSRIAVLFVVIMILLLPELSAQRRIIADTIYYEWVLTEHSQAVVATQEAQFNKNAYAVNGIVRDENGQPLKTAVVRNAAGVLLASTDENGRFEFQLPGRPVSTYVLISIEAPGKQRIIRSLHFSTFPVRLEATLSPPVVCGELIVPDDRVIKKKCCDINLRVSVQKWFVTPPARTTSRKKSR